MNFPGVLVTKLATSLVRFITAVLRGDELL